MKKNIFKIILPFVLSCNPKIKQINNENSKLLNMNCQEIITEFSYPEHLNSLDNLNYKCYDSVNINIFKDHQPYFNDKNYAIFYHHSYIKILLDKKHNQIMCFRMQDGLTEFKKESIHTIYFLDSNFFPLYKITNSTDEGKTLVLKFVYDNKNKTLDSKILNLKKVPKVGKPGKPKHYRETNQ